MRCSGVGPVDGGVDAARPAGSPRLLAERPHVPVLDQQLKVPAHGVGVQAHPVGKLQHPKWASGRAQHLEHSDAGDRCEDAVGARIGHVAVSFFSSRLCNNRTSPANGRPRRSRHAFRPEPQCRRGDAACRRCPYRGDRRALLPAPVRRASRAARRHLQPRQPGPRGAAALPLRFGGLVRDRARRNAGAHPGEPAATHRAQARLVGYPPRPVPGRARPPDVGDRRRPRRRGHPRGRRGYR